MAETICPWCRGYRVEQHWCHVCKAKGTIPDARARWNRLQTTDLNIIASAAAALAEGTVA